MSGGSTDTGGRSGVEVQVRAVEAGYGQRRRGGEILRGLHLHVGPGGVTGVVGPNGAGKTTLIRVLLGFLPPWEGRVRVDGIPAGRFRVHRGVGYVPEHVALPEAWTVFEFLGEGARLAGVSRSRRVAVVREALEREGLDAHRHGRCDRLSKGTARRVALAFALLGDPALVVLDEPWSGLDPPARMRLRDRVVDLGSSGCTVLVASHELAEVARVADRCIALGRGRVRGALTGADVTELEALFGARPPGGPA